MDVGELLGPLSGTALNLFIMVVSIGGLAVFAVLAYFGLRKYKRYSQFKCVIWERDGFGQLNEKYDRAGIFVDTKTKNKRLFLKKSVVGLSPDNIPYVPSGKKKIVYLFQTGLKNFRYVKPGSFMQVPTPSNAVGEEDVNWAVNVYERGKVTFGTNKLLQYLPFAMLAFVTIIILIIFIYFFKDFGVLKEMAVELKEAAIAVAQAKAGTVVIT